MPPVNPARAWTESILLQRSTASLSPTGSRRLDQGQSSAQGLEIRLHVCKRVRFLVLVGIFALGTGSKNPVRVEDSEASELSKAPTNVPV